MARSRLVAPGLVLAALLAVRASAAPIAYDPFDYATGDLVGQNGGDGDWSSAWTGDDTIDVVLGGFTYTDSLGNPLEVYGNRIAIASGNKTKKVERQINQTIGATTETLWLSFILAGSSGSAVNNFSLGDGLFVGQGGKDSGSTNFRLSDRDGLIDDTGVSAASQAFLAVRVDFQAGNEDVWLWIDPDLDLEPSTASADASGTAKNFNTDFVRAQLSDTSAGLDEVRFGYNWWEIVKSPEPETALLLGLGLAGLSFHSRRLQAKPVVSRPRAPTA